MAIPFFKIGRGDRMDSAHPGPHPTGGFAVQKSHPAIFVEPATRV